LFKAKSIVFEKRNSFQMQYSCCKGKGTSFAFYIRILYQISRFVERAYTWYVLAICKLLRSSASISHTRITSFSPDSSHECDGSRCRDNGASHEGVITAW